MERVLRHTLSDGALVDKRPTYRRTGTELELSSLTWLAKSAKVWSSKQVQSGNHIVKQNGELSLSPRTKSRKFKDSQNNINSIIVKLDQFSHPRPKDCQELIEKLCSALETFATPTQKLELICIQSKEALDLKESIEGHDLDAVLEASSTAFSRPMVKFAFDELSSSEIKLLLLHWASLEKEDSCLREDVPLVWMLALLIPTVEVDEPERYLKRCLKAWNRMDDDTTTLLIEIQEQLPLRESANLPTLLYFAIFRCWAPLLQTPRSLLQLAVDWLDYKRMRKAIAKLS